MNWRGRGPRTYNSRDRIPGLKEGQQGKLSYAPFSAEHHNKQDWQHRLMLVGAHVDEGSHGDTHTRVRECNEGIMLQVRGKGRTRRRLNDGGEPVM